MRQIPLDGGTARLTESLLLVRKIVSRGLVADHSEVSRRQFLIQSSLGVSSAWLVANWPGILAAQEHAQHAARSATPLKFEFFTPEQATEVEAIAAQIIPTDDTPGAREAKVVYFMDKALVTFARDQQKPFLQSLAAVHAKLRELYPAATKFSTASSEQQIAVLKAIEKTPGFNLLRVSTVAGFLSDPRRGGNREEAGWKVIGFDSSHVFEPPFGHYDRDYPGFEAAAEKEGGK